LTNEQQCVKTVTLVNDAWSGRRGATFFIGVGNFQQAITEEMMGTRSIFRVAAILGWTALTASSIAADAPAKSSSNIALNKQIERGRYVVAISGCNDCHTPNFLVNGGRTPQKDWLTGGVMGWRGPWGTTYPTNLRLYFQEITEGQWVQVAKEMQRRPPMPYFSLNAMSQADVRAMYAFIRSLGPAGKPAPAFVPPDQVPPQPYVQFPDPTK
jgi:mono/diheme cytochrome c family protein